MQEDLELRDTKALLVYIQRLVEFAEDRSESGWQMTLTTKTVWKRQRANPRGIWRRKRSSERPRQRTTLLPSCQCPQGTQRPFAAKGARVLQTVHRWIPAINARKWLISFIKFLARDLVFGGMC